MTTTRTASQNTSSYDMAYAAHGATIAAADRADMLARAAWTHEDEMDSLSDWLDQA